MKNDSAFPIVFGSLSEGLNTCEETEGLTKRELFAIELMESVWASDNQGEVNAKARRAVRGANALIAALNEDQAHLQSEGNNE